MKQIFRLSLIGLVTTFLAGNSPAWADDADRLGRGEGEVRRIDRDQGKVTVRHGPIEGMKDMPAMTMVFRTREPEMIDEMNVGDCIRFTVSRAGGAMTIMESKAIPC